MNILGEERLEQFSGPELPIKRSWSDFLRQLEDVVRTRGDRALKFAPADEFRRALRDLIVAMCEIEGLGIRLKPAGRLIIDSHLIGALIGLRYELTRMVLPDGDAEDAAALRAGGLESIATLLRVLRIAFP